MAIHTIKAIASLGVLSALTAGGAVAPQKARAPMPTHAIRGVVKSISTFYVVIVTGSGKKAREMTFVIGPSTEKDGDITIGGTVSVRYRKEGRTLVSTAVSAQPAKQRASPEDLHAAQTPRR
jgi:hypothetical protein